MATLSSGGSTPAKGVAAHPDYRCHATVHVAMIGNAIHDRRGRRPSGFSTVLPGDPQSAVSWTCAPGTPHTPVILRGVQVIPVAARI